MYVYIYMEKLIVVDDIDMEELGCTDCSFKKSFSIWESKVGSDANDCPLQLKRQYSTFSFAD